MLRLNLLVAVALSLGIPANSQVLMPLPDLVPASTIDLATVHVVARAGSTPLASARVVLDLNRNGLWDEALDEPVAWADETGLAVFVDILGAEPSAPGDGGPAQPQGWHPQRILTGNLRGTVGARDASFDFVLPPGAGRASLALHDLRGRRLAATSGDGDLMLDLPSGLPAGVYFVRLSAAPAAPVSLRITSAGERTRTVRAMRVSEVAKSAASGADTAKKDGEASMPVWVLVDHPDHPSAIVPVTIHEGYNLHDINVANLPSPQLLIAEPYLIRLTGSGTANQRAFDIAPGQPLNVQWVADAAPHGGLMTSYRWGWNLADPDDPDDPGWAVAPGLDPVHRRTPPDVTFGSGVHQLTVEARDDLARLSRWTLTLSVVPIPDPWDRLPLLLVDDVPDRTSAAWPSESGVPLDRDEFRDAFWQGVLHGPGGVVGWDPAIHVSDNEQGLLTFRDAVDYRSLIWTTRYNQTVNNVAVQFRPDVFPPAGDQDKYIWLAQYQKFAGNVLHAGSEGLLSYLANATYETPIVFESEEVLENGGHYWQGGWIRRSFGTRIEPDGTTTLVGPTRYAYDVVGVTLLDLVTRADYLEYGSGMELSSRRRAACAGFKGMRLDPAFRDAYPSADAIADTIWTEATIDWRDGQFLGDRYLLSQPWNWGNDEFYDANITDRPTPYTLQQCGDAACVEPMFRSIARYDWIRQSRLDADPEDTWPIGSYGGPMQPTLMSVCATNAIFSDLTGARTNDRIVGFIAHKTAAYKPNQVADVVLGFDPYRFDHQEMAKVIRWVLGQHFGLALNPGR